ncbi:hypothetical protein BS17DRAFT_584013 [Gyrodon lividus]|nr:hypothetical protein BS17DRAFT_584013 [Gyrodon lividus]
MLAIMHYHYLHGTTSHARHPACAAPISLFLLDTKESPVLTQRVTPLNSQSPPRFQSSPVPSVTHIFHLWDQHLISCFIIPYFYHCEIIIHAYSTSSSINTRHFSRHPSCQVIQVGPYFSPFRKRSFARHRIFSALGEPRYYPIAPFHAPRIEKKVMATPTQSHLLASSHIHALALFSLLTGDESCFPLPLPYDCEPAPQSNTTGTTCEVMSYPPCDQRYVGHQSRLEFCAPSPTHTERFRSTLAVASKNARIRGYCGLHPNPCALRPFATIMQSVSSFNSLPAYLFPLSSDDRNSLDCFLCSLPRSEFVVTFIKFINNSSHVYHRRACSPMQRRPVW